MGGIGVRLLPPTYRSHSHSTLILTSTFNRFTTPCTSTTTLLWAHTPRYQNLNPNPHRSPDPHHIPTNLRLLTQGGFSAKDLLDAGFTLEQLVAAGVSAAELKVLDISHKLKSLFGSG